MQIEKRDTKNKEMICRQFACADLAYVKGVYLTCQKS